MQQEIAVKPFLKWVGGKRQLLSILLSRMPQSINTYFEPFLGGGAVFFALSSEPERRFKRAVLSDTNQSLITTYISVRDDLKNVQQLLNEHAAKHSSEYYYTMRQLAPLEPTEQAARFIYLNKTCYNGLWRVNKSGQFNVPMGRYADPKAAITQSQTLQACSRALQGVELICQPFSALNAQANDFVYADPPYVPLNEGSFTRYQADGFGQKQQEDLRDMAKCLAKNKVSVMLSNADAPIVRQLYADFPFTCETVYVPRFVNSKAEARGTIAEVLVTTYEAAQQTASVSTKAA